MPLLQSWLGEDERSIGRFAGLFYVLSFVFMAALALELVLFLWVDGGAVGRGEVARMVVSLFLFAVFYNLAIDGRRARKALSK